MQVRITLPSTRDIHLDFDFVISEQLGKVLKENDAVEVSGTLKENETRSLRRIANDLKKIARDKLFTPIKPIESKETYKDTHVKVSMDKVVFNEENTLVFYSVENIGREDVEVYEVLGS